MDKPFDPDQAPWDKISKLTGQQPIAREKLLLADAEARQKGENIDGSPRRETKPLVRKFDTGATRDLDDNKMDFEAYLSPLVIQKYGEYMRGKQQLADGTVRSGDNWQKGIPLDAYMKSGWRHNKDWWAHHRGYPDLTSEDLEDTLCALLFNVSGYLHEVIKARRANAEAGQLDLPF